MDFKRLRGGTEGHRAEFDLRATVVKAGLVNLDPSVAGGVIDLDALGDGFTGFVIVQDDFAGKQLGHAGVVVLNDEFFQLDREGQGLQQHAVGLAQDGGVGLGAFGHGQIAPKGGIGHRQAVLVDDFRNTARAIKRRFAAQPHLGTND